MAQTNTIPKAFLLRRLHSLTGIWLVLFLIEHLLVNSQAALWLGEDGSGFVEAVNGIHNLPYLQAIEISLLAIPIGIHLFWGLQYLKTGVTNSHLSDGTRPSLPQYLRNHAYTWQRITSWILLVLLLGHVVHMRFLEYPVSAQIDAQKYYFVRLNHDAGLSTLSERLNVELFDKQGIELQKKTWGIEPTLSSGLSLLGDEQKKILEEQKKGQQKAFVEALEEQTIKDNQVIAVAKDFGTAELLVVRDAFKNPWMIIFYTILVFAACFHAFNGLWTFLITWGISLTERSQKITRFLANVLMGLVTFFGLAAIWATYWINLRY